MGRDPLGTYGAHFRSGGKLQARGRERRFAATFPFQVSHVVHLLFG